MKVNKLLVTFLIAQFAILNSQIEPNIIIKNNMGRTIYYHIVTKISADKQVTAKTKFLPINPKEIVKKYIDLSTNPEIYIKSSQSSKEAFDISIKRDVDRRNKVINLEVKTLDYPKGISLVKSKNNFKENELLNESIFLITQADITKDPYKVLTAAINSWSSADYDVQSKQKDFSKKNVTASSPTYRKLGFQLETNPKQLTEQKIKNNYDEILKKIEYLKNVDPKLYQEVVIIINDARKELKK